MGRTRSLSCLFVPVVVRFSTLQYYLLNRSVKPMKIFFGVFLRATVISRTPYCFTTVHGFIFVDQVGLSTDHGPIWHNNYRKTFNISRTLVGNEIVDNPDVVGASPVGAAPTAPSFSTQHLASMDWAKTAATGYKKQLSFWIWCDLY